MNLIPNPDPNPTQAPQMLKEVACSLERCALIGKPVCGVSWIFLCSKLTKRCNSVFLQHSDDDMPTRKFTLATVRCGW